MCRVGLPPAVFFGFIVESYIISVTRIAFQYSSCFSLLSPACVVARFRCSLRSGPWLRLHSSLNSISFSWHCERSHGPILCSRTASSFGTLVTFFALSLRCGSSSRSRRVCRKIFVCRCMALLLWCVDCACFAWRVLTVFISCSSQLEAPFLEAPTVHRRYAPAHRAGDSHRSSAIDPSTFNLDFVHVNLTLARSGGRSGLRRGFAEKLHRRVAPTLVRCNCSPLFHTR